MIKKVLFWNFNLLFVFGFFVVQATAQHTDLTRNERKCIQLKQLVKRTSDCDDQGWSSLSREISLMFGGSVNGEIINDDVGCSTKAINDYYLKTNNQFQGRNTKIYFFEQRKVKDSGNKNFDVFSSTEELIKLVRSELKDGAYSKRKKLDLIIVQGPVIPDNWLIKMENDWLIEKPISDYNSENEIDCNCRSQILYKIKPCKNVREFEFEILDNMRPNATEDDAINIFPTGEEGLFMLQTKQYCGKAFRFRFYDDKNKLMREMEFKDDEVITDKAMIFRIYPDNGNSGTIPNHIAEMNRLETYTLKVSALVDNQWMDCQGKFRINFQMCALDEN